MRQAGRYLPEYRSVRAQANGFLDLCYTPEKATEVTLQPLRRYGFDAAILFSDILVIPDALGQAVRFQEGEGPKLSPIRTSTQLDALTLDGFQEHLRPVFETVSRLKTAIPTSTALIGFAGAPWTVATYMVEGSGSKDFLETKAMAYGHPELFQRLIDLLVKATGDYLIAQIDHGAEAIQLFDSWAGTLPEDEFVKWVIAPTRRLVERIKTERPGVPVIGFPRGAGALYQAFVEQTGVDAVSLDTGIPLGWAVKVLQPKVALQGNLDPVMVVTGGAALDAAVDRILSVCNKGPFIFNLGHGILQTTPPDHVARLVERVRAWRG
jgi:uroporphyrinogen decarboxylase